MKWIKKGLIYVPKENRDWSLTHTQVPVADFIDDNKIRIYYKTNGYDEYN